MSLARRCSRTACSGRAVATLTYSYGDQTVVIGPLSAQSDPSGYDLCERHAVTLGVPRGWQVVQLPRSDAPAPADEDDLLALANAIRDVGLRYDDPEPGAVAGDNGMVVLAQKGHLRVLTDPQS